MIKASLRRVLEKVPLFRSNEFRITAYDLVRRTHRLWADTSPLSLYLDWRHEQIDRLALQPREAQPSAHWVFDSYYGKVDRIALVASFLKSTSAVPGDVAEFGVFRGDTALVMDRVLAEGAPGKQLYLFDSFEGMPEVKHPLDSTWQKGDLANPVDGIREAFKGSARAAIMPGYFADSLPRHPDLRFAFCHVDCDLYDSVKECIDYIMPRLSDGGIIVFDDYGFRDCAGAKQAIQEGFGEHNRPVVPLPTGQAVYFHTGVAVPPDEDAAP